jgi:hypothetical protein
MCLTLLSVLGSVPPHRRGKALEGVLNDLFRPHNMLVREAFTLRGIQGEGIVEQVDGLVEFENHLYFVEMKWHSNTIGRSEILPHLVSIYNRGDVRGIFISASGFAPAAIVDVRTALTQKTCVLFTWKRLFGYWKSNSTWERHSVRRFVQLKLTGIRLSE